MSKTNNFTFIAPIYDLLAKVAFAGSIRKSQVSNLRTLRPGSYILIMGGGTGWILNELDCLDIPLRVTYLEPSKGMMRRAKEWNVKNIEVHYVYQLEPAVQLYDVIMTYYYLDLFKIEDLREELNRIRKMLREDGRLFFADFEIAKGGLRRRWQQGMSWLMHLFFRAVANLESKKLQNLDKELIQFGFVKRSEEYYYSRFICSRVYSYS